MGDETPPTSGPPASRKVPRPAPPFAARAGPPRGGLPPRAPPQPAAHQRARPKEHRFARWMRHKREFLLEELGAYGRVGMALLVGLLFVIACLMFAGLRNPRFGGFLFRLFGG